MKTHKRSKKRKAQQQRYVDKNKPMLNKKSLDRRNRLLGLWREYMSKYKECECCGQEIEFMNKKNKLCFDHRNEGREAIKGSPNHWLYKNPCTPANIVIWESCNFGALCSRCNVFLPTKNRKRFLELAEKYVNQNWN
jgi:hypothetical protein